MVDRKPATRLFVEAPLTQGGALELSKEQAHFLRSVLRLAPGTSLLLFNGYEGEWLAEIEVLEKKSGRLPLLHQTRVQQDEPDLWLAFAPIKAGRIDWLVEKAVELGVSRLLPARTRRTIVERINLERLRANAREAAEQCERLSLPTTEPLQPLTDLLAAWPEDRRLLVADESGKGLPLPAALEGGGQPLGLLVGPEGGFAPEEQEMLAASPCVTRINLGPRILRAETAALAGLSVIQALAGDWGQPARGGLPEKQ